MKLNTVICGDIFNVMPNIADKSIDMILTDMPYNTTACSWDKEVIPLDKLWEGFKRIIKDNGAIVMTASQPFTSKLVMSNLDMFKYEWIWDKTFGKEPFALNKRPMKSHEDICLFYKHQPIFNAQRTIGKPYVDKRKNQKIKSEHYTKDRIGIINNGTREPISVILFKHGNQNQFHPTQKPVALFEYLIKTYTNEGDTVFDGFAGSFTTAIAAQNLRRNWICVEKEEKYCKIGRTRLAQGVLQL